MAAIASTRRATLAVGDCAPDPVFGKEVTTCPFPDGAFWPGETAAPPPGSRVGAIVAARVTIGVAAPGSVGVVAAARSNTMSTAVV